MEYILMCRDRTVGTYKGDWSWVGENEKLLPKNIKVECLPKDVEGNPLEIAAIYAEIFYSNKTSFVNWCAGRVLSIDRVNAKRILNELGLSQSQTNDEKAKVALTYRCVSLIDGYWVKLGPYDNAEWKDIRLLDNPLNHALALVALKGISISMQAKHGLTAEVTTLGSYAKGWFRIEEDNVPYLYKTYGGEGDEVEREVCASTIIDCFNVYGNVKYKKAVMEGVICSRCKVMTSETRGIIHAADFNAWCIRNGTNAVNYAVRHYGENFAQMIVIDYLIANSDRHGYNWGFYQSMESGDILGLHDLYDHNNAFDKRLMANEDAESIVLSGITMKNAAESMLHISGLKNTKRIEKSMFPNSMAYTTFVNRCEQIGINLI
jgi:hypothetical protein